MNRVGVFIDGFNLYHAIEDLRLDRKYKWLNVVGLAKALITKKDHVAHFAFFTTIVPWSDEKAARHREYISALGWAGAEVILGEFHRKDILCAKCHKVFSRYEEKQTDVNIAVQLLKHAQKNTCDTFLLISGDSDLVPAVTLIKELYPQKKIVVGVPPGRRAKQLLQVAHGHQKIRSYHITNNPLPTTIILPSGHRIISPYQ